MEVALGEARRLRGAGAGAGVGAGVGAGAGAGAGAGMDLVVVGAGTGSGAIALALATELGPAVVHEVWATDTGAAALKVARANRERCRAASSWSRGAGWPRCRHGTRPRRPGGVEPAVLSEAEWSALEPEVRAEPRQALVAGEGEAGAAGRPTWRPCSGSPPLAGPPRCRRRRAGAVAGRTGSRAGPCNSGMTRCGSRGPCRTATRAGGAAQRLRIGIMAMNGAGDRDEADVADMADVADVTDVARPPW